MINVNELKPGITFKYKNNAYVLLDSIHSKSGRGQAHVKAKVKNLNTGATTNITFTGGQRVEKAFVETKGVQFLYIDGDKAYFMNTETFEQIEISIGFLKKELKFLTEGLNVKTKVYESKVIGIELPTNVTLEIIEAPDAVKGDTVNNALKKIKLETGIEIEAPQFVTLGDKIVVNSETGKYVSKG